MDPQNPNNQTPAGIQPAQAVEPQATPVQGATPLLTEVPAVQPVQPVAGQMPTAATGTEPVAPIPPAPVTNPAAIPVQSVEQTGQGSSGQPLNQNDSGQVGQGGNQ